jgi:phospholipid transport system substrate-binding protein
MTIKKSIFYRYYTIACLGIILSLSSIQTANASSEDAANYINDLAARVISIVKRKDIDNQSKENQLNAIFLRAVDTKWIGRFAMGRYWRGITSKQKAQFLGLYSNYLTGLYVPNFRKYTGNIIKVTAVKEVRPKEYLVTTKLTDELNTIDIKIDYHILQKDTGLENFVIFDIIAEGVSLITTQRAEINSIMAQDGFDDLIKLLIQKT